MTEPTTVDRGSYVVLSGGVGGAKLVLGLSHVMPADRLAIVANTGDDFEHLGLRISPDIDTLMYTLGDVVDPETGWGCRDETWAFMDALGRLGGETWFRLGDRDLATHVFRTQMLAAGAQLSEVTAALCARFDIRQRIFPMSDQDVRTRVLVDDGALDFQHYFVRERAQPRVHRIDYHGADRARPTAAALAAMHDPALAGIIIAPSNPYLSIDPILSIPELRAVVSATEAPVVAISPIVGGAAIKGPTAKIMRELGVDVSPAAVAAHYGDLLDGLIIDVTDRDSMADVLEATARANPNLEVVAEQTVMTTLEDKIGLATATLDLLGSLSRRLT